ncbi:MAG: hypothetical protein E7561_01875 [Ruminococcaceae bacterium]|nr:hypothetical protein [Oscillospiraceae bacterium]
MKRILMLALSLVLILATLVGCGKDERILYNVDLSKHIKVGDYKGVEVDTNSDEYKTQYQTEIDNDVIGNELYNELKEGTVQDGDITNIDYVGKKDGVAFEGGTADGYELEIGSNSFIDGFEDGLIGVEVGSTVDLNLKFPENYGNEELNGAAVVFTVTVNSVKRAMEPKEAYKELGFKTLKAYELDLKNRAASACVINKLTEDAKIIKYSEKDVDLLYNQEHSQMETYYSAYYGMTLESILSQSGMTEEDFKKQVLENSTYPNSKAQMVLYYIFDKEGMSVTKDEINAKIKEIVEKNEGATTDTVKEYYGEYYFEYLVVSEKVSDFLCENAKVK